MKQITNEWIAKAEGDFGTAQRELSATDSPTTTPYASTPNNAQRNTSKRSCKSPTAALDEAQEAFQKCQNIRDVIRRALQL